MGRRPGAVSVTSKADFPSVDMTNPRQFRTAVQNIHTMFNSVTPAERADGADWYPKVHEAVAKGVKGTSTSPEAGAGIVAAVSPNMDWEKRNIDAFDELHHLRESHWKAIAAGDRSPLAGMSIRVSGTENLLKAHRILQGESVDDVLPRRTAPKTNSFAHNIMLDPEPVTIDGRAHDIAANRMQPWEMGRGVNSADLTRGTSRYEHFERAYHAATGSINEEHGSDLHPFQVQAAVWVGGKAREREGLTKAGEARKLGVRRLGQPYV